MKNWANAIFLLTLLAGSACTPAHPSATVLATATMTPQVQATLRGRAVDADGKPLVNASVDSDEGHAVTGQDGWFSVQGGGQVEWVTVKQAGYFARTRAVSPDAPALFRLTADDGQTVLIRFGGDTMLGRRFFDPNEDGDPSDGLLPTNPSLDDIRKLLLPVQELIGNGDLFILNLEGPLADPAYFSLRDARPSAYHSTKEYVFASPSLTAQVLKQIGVSGVDLANNHVYDLLESGVTSTLSFAEQAGLQHFGAGPNEATAWTPAIFHVKGQSIAFLGCTTVTRPFPPMSTNDVSYAASDKLHKGGAAHCEGPKLAAAVLAAKQQSNFVVVMIHGGEEYNALPTGPVQEMTAIARNAGAALVVNGHPHVVGGFSWDQKSLVAWSMGNFIFDQTIWPTFQGYVLSVYLRDGRIVGAYADPVMIENYLPRGIAGDLADRVAREAAGLLPGPFVLEDGTMEVAVGQPTTSRTKTISMNGGTDAGVIVTVPASQWITGFDGTGTLTLGQDLLWIGGFENMRVGGQDAQPPLWDLTSQGIQFAREFAYQGQTGLRLTRGSMDQGEAVTSSLHRLLITPGAQLSVLGMIRSSNKADARIRISWYPDTKGSSSSQVVEPLVSSSGQGWQPFRLDLTAPNDAAAVQVYLTLKPPPDGTATADFDNLRVIKWADKKAPFSPLYDCAWLKGTGLVTFSQQVLKGGEAWFTLPE